MRHATAIIAALSMLTPTDCPPHLIPFDVDRVTDADGITWSSGEGETDTRRIIVSYQDNRTTASAEFRSTGVVTMVANEGRRRIKYRMQVQIPRGVAYVVDNPDGTPWVGGYDACAEDGVLVVYAERAVDFHTPRSTSWDVLVLIGLLGDFNDDGRVDGRDLAAVLANWGFDGVTDLDGNDTTDGSDLAILFANWTG